MDITAVIELDQVRFGYGGEALLPPVSASIYPGELWVIVGPNGAGKSTLLKTALGLLRPLGGRVSRGGTIGYVPQRSRFEDGVPGRSIDVVCSGAGRGWSFLRPWTGPATRTRARSVLREVGAEPQSQSAFATLSEGQRQRVAIARALVDRPDLLVLDEPTSAMDVVAEHRVMELLETLRRTRGCGVLMVSHNLPVVAEFATHALILDREGPLALAGPVAELGDRPEVVARYGDLFSAARCAGGPRASTPHGAREHGHHAHLGGEASR
ncbi:MAG: metal ABC transporter ATP-binding protein [Myxococcales bacterium]|nr:metal ABC transporter ATP-binding protein [Myxococcales bacterium]